MRTLVCMMIAVCLLSGAARAQDKPNPDELKKAYDDALGQLRAAQDSKNALAKENDQLRRQVEDLKKQLAAGQGQIENLKREVSDNDRKTFYLRACQGAWQNFLRAHPEVMVRWKAFLAGDVLALPQEQEPKFDFKFPESDEPTSFAPKPFGSGQG
jgi:septal ring factor EnvC (AmiA/AmiB activator)